MMKTREQIAVLVLLMSLIGAVVAQSCKCREFHGNVVIDQLWPFRTNLLLLLWLFKAICGHFWLFCSPFLASLMQFSASFF